MTAAAAAAPNACPITGCTENIVLDLYPASRPVGSFATEWINQKRGGKAQVGLLPILTGPELIVCSQGRRRQGLKDGVRQNCLGAEFAGEVASHTVERGAAAANLPPGTC
jgi:hypothetical protein